MNEKIEVIHNDGVYTEVILHMGYRDVDIELTNRVCKPKFLYAVMDEIKTCINASTCLTREYDGCQLEYLERQVFSATRKYLYQMGINICDYNVK